MGELIQKDLAEKISKTWPIKTEAELQKAQAEFVQEWQKQQKEEYHKKYTRLYHHLPYLFKWTKE